MILDDTIVAISSATGPAARMILRLSGLNSFSIGASLAAGSAEDFPSASAAQWIRLLFTGMSVPAWIYTFAGPHSYTAQDVVEFHIPGNSLLARVLLDHLILCGARLAEPGEFTARAFFNGKIDLSQAEGVSATIAAQSQEQLNAARQLLAGELSRRLGPVMDLLAETLALVETDIDFAEEGIQSLSMAALENRIDSCIAQLDLLISESGRLEELADEPTIVLAGLPNAGKSTLTNALSGVARSVISPHAGTTRDVLSVEIALRRGIARLIDIAGLDALPATDASTESRAIDRQMQARALRAIEQADVLVLVQDSTDSRPRLSLSRKPDLVVFSKIDIGPAPEDFPDAIGASALTGLGIDALRDALDQLAFATDTRGAAVAMTARHLELIHDSFEILSDARRRTDHFPEIVAADLRSALDSLGQVLGLVTPDDILGKIFATFCIGK